MGNELLASKVIIQEEPPRIQNITGSSTAITSALGVTERGPVGVPTLTTSFEEWADVFGGNIADSDLAAQVEGFYKNAPGAQLWTVRVVHHSDIADSASKTSEKATISAATLASTPSQAAKRGVNASPFAMHNADTLVVEIDGSPFTATFSATAASITNGTNNSPFALADGDTLTVIVDQGATQTVTFLASEVVAIGAATAAEVASIINASLVGASASVVSGPKVKITSDKRGTGSHVHVTGGLANAGGKLNFSTTETNGTGNVADISQVTAAEAASIVGAALTGGTAANIGGFLEVESDSSGVLSTVQIMNTSVGGAAEFGFDFVLATGSDGASVDTLTINGKYDGTYANDLSIEFVAATSGVASKFNAEVLRGTVIVERFPNVTMDQDDDRYIETVINDPDNGSKIIAVVDLQIPGTTISQRRPADGTYGPLAGGDDGLVGLDDNDFVGNAAGGTGLRSLDHTLGIRLLTAPGQATAAVHNEMIAYGEITRSGEIFSVLDPPEGLTAVQMQTYVVSTAALRGLSEFGAIYWPRIKILNPSKSIFGNTDQIVVAPSLHICGMYARTDSSKPGGVYVPPAGEDTGKLIGALGVETNEVLDEGKRDIIFPDLINPIAKYPGTPVHCDGARTLKDTGSFPTIGERRGVIFIEQAIKDFLRTKKHKVNIDSFRAELDRSVTSFLLIQMKSDAFQSQDPAKAFSVDVSKALNPPSVIFARQAKVRIGLATNKPSEFIFLLVAQDTRAIEEEIAAAG